MRKALHCQTCGRKLAPSEVAARIDSPEVPPRVWCFGCWDTTERAVDQYRMAGPICVPCYWRACWVPPSVKQGGIETCALCGGKTTDVVWVTSAWAKSRNTDSREQVT